MFKFGNGIAANSTVDLAELLIVTGLGVGESAKKLKGILLYLVGFDIRVIWY